MDNPSIIADRAAGRARLRAFVPVVEAIALLFRPHVEVVLHDLELGEIVHIGGGLSKRQIGDSSLTDLHDIGAIDASVMGPYPKINWDGRRLKAVTAVLRNDNGSPAGLLCINLDISIFDAVQAACRDILCFDAAQSRPDVLFREDWREDVNDIVGQYLADHGATPARLDRRQRAALIALLEARGIFEVRNATTYVAILLGLSRATLYKSLKALRAPIFEEKHQP